MLYHLIANCDISDYVVWVTNDDFTEGIELGNWRSSILDAINPAELIKDQQPLYFEWLDGGNNSIILTQSEPFTPNILTKHPELLI